MLLRTPPCTPPLPTAVTLPLMSCHSNHSVIQTVASPLISTTHPFSPQRAPLITSAKSPMTTYFLNLDQGTFTIPSPASRSTSAEQGRTALIIPRFSEG